MSHAVVGAGGEETLAMAAHAASPFAQGMTAQQQRELERAIQQSTREQLQAVRAAQEAARVTRSQIVQSPAAPGAPALPAPPPVSGLVISPDGRHIVIGGPSGGRGPVATVTGQGSNPNVEFYAPNVPDGAVIISVAFFIMLAFIAVGLPLARAIARRMDRKSLQPPPSSFPIDVSDRITRIEQAVEAIAIEVERVSEGQRFTTRLLSEMRTPAAIAASASQYEGGKR